MKRFILTGIALCILSAGDARAQAPEVRRSESIVRIDGDTYYVHTVSAGETLYSLAKAYGVTTAAIVHYNPLIAGGLKAGEVLKIPAVGTETPKMSQRKINRLFDEHTVAQGETTYSISRMYSVPVATLIEDNPSLDPTHLSIGQKVLIRKESKGDSDEKRTMSELEQYKDALNSVSTDYTYHVVAHGETLFSLSREYGIPQDSIIVLNSLTGGLKAGEMIRLPREAEAEVPEAVRQPEEEDLGDNVEITVNGDRRHANIALLLPLRVDGAANRNYLEFYQGFMLGLADLKEEGLSFSLDLYNTARSESEVENIISSYGFDRADIIVGPVYDNELDAILPYARRHRIAVVSPLAAADALHSPVLFGMAPLEKSKTAKMRELFSPEDNIVLVYGSSTDTDLEREVKEALDGIRYTVFDYRNAGSIPSTLFRSNCRNVYAVLAQNELEVDKILAALSSAHNNLVSRSQLHSAAVNVVGSSRWNRFNNIDRNLFFKLGVCYLSSYMAKRGDGVIDRFDSRYVEAFQSLPSMYSYRGYDAAAIFGRAAVSYGGIVDYVTSEAHTPLQTTYRFSQERRGDTYTNTEWSIIRYNTDYTITGE